MRAEGLYSQNFDLGFRVSEFQIGFGVKIRNPNKGPRFLNQVPTPDFREDPTSKYPLVGSQIR